VGPCIPTRISGSLRPVIMPCIRLDENKMSCADITSATIFLPAAKVPLDPSGPRIAGSAGTVASYATERYRCWQILMTFDFERYLHIS